MFCAKFGWNWLSGSYQEDFLMLVSYFCYIAIISPWKRPWTFIWTNLNPRHPRLGWNWPSGFGKDFLRVIKVCFLCRLYLLYGKVVVLDLYNFKFPLSKGALYQVCLKLTKWVWRRRKKCDMFTKRRRKRDRSEKLNWIFYIVFAWYIVSKLLRVFQNCHLIEKCRIVTHQRPFTGFISKITIC